MRRLPPHLGPSLGAIAVATALVAISPYALLVMAPALALAWLVAVGLFTGEQAISWVRRIARRTRRASRGRGTSALRPPRRDIARGGLLIAAGLASRPPPAIG